MEVRKAARRRRRVDNSDQGYFLRDPDRNHLPGSPPINIEYWTGAERTAYFSSMPLGRISTNIFGCLLAAVAGGWVTAMVSKEREKTLLPFIVGVSTYFIGIVAFVIVEGGITGLGPGSISLIMFIPV